MPAEGSSEQDRTLGQADVRDGILMREIQFLGAVIADVEGRANHLTLEEVDQVLERAGAALEAETPSSQEGPETEPKVEDGTLPCG